METPLGLTLGFHWRDKNFLIDSFIHRHYKIVARSPVKTVHVTTGDRLLSLTVSMKNVVLEDALTLLSYAAPYRVRLKVRKRSSGSIASSSTARLLDTSADDVISPTSAAVIVKSQSLADVRVYDGDDRDGSFLAGGPSSGRYDATDGLDERRSRRIRNHPLSFLAQGSSRTSTHNEKPGRDNGLTKTTSVVVEESTASARNRPLTISERPSALTSTADGGGISWPMQTSDDVAYGDGGDNPAIQKSSAVRERNYERLSPKDGVTTVDDDSRRTMSSRTAPPPPSSSTRHWSTGLNSGISRGFVTPLEQRTYNTVSTAVQSASEAVRNTLDEDRTKRSNNTSAHLSKSTEDSSHRSYSGNDEMFAKISTTSPIPPTRRDWSTLRRRYDSNTSEHRADVGVANSDATNGDDVDDDDGDDEATVVLRGFFGNRPELFEKLGFRSSAKLSTHSSAATLEHIELDTLPSTLPRTARSDKKQIHDQKISAETVVVVAGASPSHVGGGNLSKPAGWER